MKLLLIIFSIVFFNYSYSCSCAIRGELSIRDYFEPDIILLGTVIKIQENKDTPEIEYNTKEITLQVKKFYKGFSEKKEIKIYTSFWDASCGLAVNNTGEQWIIFAYKNAHGFLLTDMCTPSKTIKNQEDEYITKLTAYSKAQGFTKFYNKDNVLHAEGEMIDNKPNGFWKFYPAFLSSHETGFYNNGIKDSTWTLFNPNGKIDRIVNYKNGKRHGAYIQYQWHNGNPSRINYYSEDKYHGKHLVFYENGMLMIEGQYENNRPKGTWVAYDKQGNIVCTTMDIGIGLKKIGGPFTCQE